MLKMTLLDSAVNEKCCSAVGGRGICPVFSSPPRGIWQLKSPHPREFAIQGKKNANAWGVSLGGGVGARHSWNWLILEYTNSKIKNLPCHLALANKQQEDIM